MSKNKRQSLTFKSLLLDNPFGLFIAILIGAVASLAAVALLGISGWFLSAAGLASAVGTALAFDYFTPGASVRLMAILRTAGRYGEQVFSHEHLLGLLRSLRLWVWDQRVATSPDKLYKQTKGDLLQRLVGDLDQIIKWPLAVLMPWIYGLLGCLGLVALAYWVAPILVLPVLLFALLQLAILPWWSHREALRAVHRMQVLSTYRRSRFMSVFSALVTLTIRGHWRHYGERLQALDNRQRAVQGDIQQTSSLAKWLGQCVTLLLILSMFALVLTVSDSSIVLRDGIQGTWLVALILATLGVNELVQPIALSFIAQGQSEVGLKRLNQLQPEATEAHSQPQPIAALASIQLQQFSGRYQGSVSMPMTTTATVSLKVGDRVRLSGPSGAGKSTCLTALAGDLYYSGRVCVNGEYLDIQDNPHWRAKITYLPQQAIIFQQSLAANLRLGAPNATDEELLRVLSTLGLGEWLETLPMGLNTLLGAQGRDISGGQARRIALARVLLRRSELILLDEPFDGLDSSSIKRVCDALLSSEFRPNFLIYVSHVDSDLDTDADVVSM